MVGAVAAAFIAAQLVTEDYPFGWSQGGTLTTYYWYGWPAWCRCRTQVADFNPPFTTSTQYHWKAIGFLLNGVTGLVLIASTVFIGERWRRHGWQFNIRSLLLVVAAAAAALAFYRSNEYLVAGGLVEHQYLLVPLGIGTVCAVFTFARLTRWLLSSGKPTERGGTEL
jgi:hypothetical protein